jgi:hypothetical protein
MSSIIRWRGGVNSDAWGAHCAHRQLFGRQARVHDLCHQRPEAAWWTSFSATIGALFDAPDQVPLPQHLRTVLNLAIELIQVQTFGCPPTDREGVLAA